MLNHTASVLPPPACAWLPPGASATALSRLSPAEAANAVTIPAGASGGGPRIAVRDLQPPLLRSFSRFMSRLINPKWSNTKEDFPKVGYKAQW